MKDRIKIDSRNGVFAAYIAQPETLPAPGVVVLHEVFGVNADIRKHCDELAKQDFTAVAPDLFWRQEPGVDLSVTIGVRPRGEFPLQDWLVPVAYQDFPPELLPAGLRLRATPFTRWAR